MINLHMYSLFVRISLLSIYCEFGRLTSSTVIHSYYKLNWIELHWGGANEQAEAIQRGKKGARNWLDEAEELVETVVCA